MEDSKDTKKQSFFKVILAQLFLIASFAISYLLFKHFLAEDITRSSNQFDRLLVSHFNTVLPKAWDLESKLKLLSMVYAHFALFLLVLTTLIFLCRITFLQPSVANKEDPDVIRILNRVYDNTLEHSLVFLGFLTYWTLGFCTEKNKIQILIFTAIFLAGRLLFFVGLFVNHYLDFTLFRQLAIVLGFTNVGILGARVFLNLDLVSYL